MLEKKKKPKPSGTKGEVTVPKIPLFSNALGDFELDELKLSYDSKKKEATFNGKIKLGKLGPIVIKDAKFTGKGHEKSKKKGGKKKGGKKLSATLEGADDSKPKATPKPTVSIALPKKDFGPIHLNKIDLSLDSLTQLQVSIQPDASVNLSGLEIALDGLKIPVSIPAPPKDPSVLTPALDSLSLSYSNDSIKLVGAFFHSHTKAGDEFAGEALVKLSAYELGAMGAYFQPSDHSKPPSLFIFALLKGEIGGPPYFFLTGIAGGFGYNYQLKTPDVDDVSSFPFVQMATGGGDHGITKGSPPKNVLSKLDKHLSPLVGQYWAAAGVAFTSFEMLDSFALLTVAFGTNLEVALMGTTTVTVPKMPSGEKKKTPPIGQAELELLVDFSEASGVIKAADKLNPKKSFILDKDCHIRGGFAFYLWFAGEHAGDFVVTLGGYHPDFKKPAHYPHETRLGLNWKLGKGLQIDGGIYFALTPSAVMAGGRLEATFTSGNLKAWFNEEAHFFLNWKPFHYDLKLGLHLGVSYLIKVWFVQKKITAQLGADAHLYGSPFGGTATIDLHLFKVTIPFGDSTPPPKLPIPWSGSKESFETSFLPHITQNKKSVPSIVHVRITDGLVKDQDDDKTHPAIVKAADLSLVSKTAIPAKAVSLNGTEVSAANLYNPDSLPTWTTDFGVGPVAVAASDFSSEHKVTLQRKDEVKNKMIDCTTTDFNLEPIYTNSPKALWGPYRESQDKALLNGKDGLIKNTLVGFKITPKKKLAGSTSQPIDVKTLSFQYQSDDVHSFNWQSPTIPNSDSFDQTQSISQIKTTISEGGSSKDRADIVTALQRYASAINTKTKVDVTQMAAHAGEVLLAKPMLKELGEVF